MRWRTKEESNCFVYARVCQGGRQQREFQRRFFIICCDCTGGKGNIGLVWFVLRFMLSLVAVFSQTAGSKKGLLSILVSEVLAWQEIRSPGLTHLCDLENLLAGSWCWRSKPKYLVGIYMYAFPGFFVLPDILCHQQPGFKKGPTFV